MWPYLSVYPPGQVILDIEIGTGLSSALFYRAGLKVEGMDVSDTTIEACRKKRGAARLVRQYRTVIRQRAEHPPGGGPASAKVWRCWITRSGMDDGTIRQEPPGIPSVREGGPIPVSSLRQPSLGLVNDVRYPGEGDLSRPGTLSRKCQNTRARTTYARATNQPNSPSIMLPASVGVVSSG